jgi:hypothetical protein
MTEVFDELQTASFLVYGETKHGKSSLLATMPTPGVILDDEGKWQFFQGRANPNRDGQPFRLKLWNPAEAPPKADGTWDFAIVKVTSAKVLAQTLPWLDRTDHPFVSIGLDSLTVGQEQGIEALRKVDEDFRIQDWGAIRRRILSDTSRIMTRVSDPTNPLRVFAATAHSVFKDGKHRPAMQGGIQIRLPFSFDGIIFMKKALEKPHAQPDGTVADEAATVFRALVKTHPAYVTGSNFEERFDRTAYDNPNLTHIMRLIFPATAETKG